MGYKSVFLLATFLFGPVAIFSQGIAYKSLKACEQIPEEVFRSPTSESILSLKALPKGLYLVRSISQSLEKSETEKYYSYQKLDKNSDGKNQFCYEGTPSSSLKVQTFLPTVIDLTKERKWGHAYWSILVSADKKTGAIEANRSLIPGEDYKEKLAEQGFTVEERQKSHHEYELKIQRSVANWKETVVVLYDQF